MPTALITGASAGLGRALAAALAVDGWTLVIDGRRAGPLAVAAADLGPTVTAVAGDVTDPAHRAELLAAVPGGRLDLLVNNASDLGPSPLKPLVELSADELRRIYEVNVVAPLALIGAARFTDRAAVVNVSSDAAVEPYPTWGGYGSSKAALDHASAVLAVEKVGVAVYAFDPGDMRTAMHQAAFPGEDISDRAEPETVVPVLRRLLRDRPASGRYRAADLSAGAAS